MHLPAHALNSLGFRNKIAFGFLSLLLLALAPSPAHAQSNWRTLSDARAQNGLWMATTTSGWIVGDNGLIRHTDDGGATWTIQNSGTTATLRAIWGYDADNVWAVGDGGTLLYWDGTEWFDQSDAGTTENLLAIHGSDFDNIWVSGEDGVVLHFDGTDWTRDTPSVAIGTHLRGVWAPAADNTWMVGDLGLIMHWDGTDWTDESLATQANLYCIGGVPGASAWIGGQNGVMLKWNGTAFAASSSTGTTQTIRSLWAADTTHMWAVAENGVIRFHNGSSWSAQASGGMTANILGVKTLSATSAIAVGDRGLVGKFSAGAWTVTTAQAPNVSLNDTWTLDSDEVWVVGGNGTAARYHNQTLAFTATNVFDDLHGVSGIPDGIIWAVGANGTIIRWDGTHWIPEASGVTEVLYGVWAKAVDDVWAVGEAGTILHWDGSLWEKTASGTTRDLYAIAGSGNSIWAVGQAGAALRNTGSGWKATPSGTTSDLFDVWAASNVKAIAVGAGGVIRVCNGSTWSGQASGTTDTLRGIGGTDLQNVWSVGGSTILTMNAGSWENAGSDPAATALLCVAATTPQSVFLAGMGGTVFTNLPTPLPEIAIEITAGKELRSHGSGIDYGAHKTTDPATVVSITIRNVGNDALSGLDASMAGTNADEFTATPLLATSLDPGASTTFSVSFLPTDNGSRTAELTVTSDDLDESTFVIPLTGIGLIPTEITEQPQSATVDPGDAVIFSVSATGSDPITYQWRKDGTDIDGATDSSYSIDAAQEDDEGDYTCVVSGAFGDSVTSDPATLSVNDPVLIVADPAAQVIAGGTTATFEVTVTGSDPLKYQWRKNGKAIPGATQSTYVIPAAAATHAGTYSVVVSNSVNTVTSAGALLTVVDITPRTLCLPVGTASATLTVTSTAPVTTYTWGKDGDPLPADYRYTGWTGRALTIKQFRTADTGVFSCTVDTLNGSVAVSTSIIIYSNGPQVTQSGPMPDAIVGCTYGPFSIPVNSSNDKKPTKFSATGLPPGLKCDATTGAITGRPLIALTADRTYKVALIASNALGSSHVDTTLLVKAMSPSTTGSFTGPLTRDADLNKDLGGIINVTIAINGALTGKLTLGTLNYAFTGALSPDDANPGTMLASATIKRTGGAAALDISFSVNPATGRLENGDVTDGTAHSAFAAWRKKWGTAMPPAELADLRTYLGYYTFGIELGAGAPTDGSVPEGIGYGSFTIAASGALTQIGRLSDGTAFTCTTFSGPQGEVLLYQALYAGKGSVLGQFDITQGTQAATPAYGDNTLAGTATWLRPAITGRLYADGFGPVDLNITGGRYVPPAAPTIVLGLAETGIENATLAFGPAGINTQILPDVDVRIRSIATITMPLDNPRFTKLSINATTGGFTGSFLLEDRNPAVPGSNVMRPATYQGLITRSGSGLKGAGYVIVADLPAADSSETIKTTKQLSAPVVLGPK